MSAWRIQKAAPLPPAPLILIRTYLSRAWKLKAAYEKTWEAEAHLWEVILCSVCMVLYSVCLDIADVYKGFAQMLLCLCDFV